MKIFSKINEIRSEISEYKKKNMSIGFVPTMGALHSGHIQLVEKSVNENDVTVVSIFVNPVQFNNPEDLKKYPRNLNYDLDLLGKTGCTIVFTPSTEEMYPEKINDVYEFGNLDKVMEGQFRPGHFNGVAIVVKKFFDIVTPDKAYFGEKDFQQLTIIKNLTENLHLPVLIIPCPTVRESDGLAMSSRNMRLSNEERKSASLISQKLSGIKNLLTCKTIEQTIDITISEINSVPFLKTEYLEIVDDKTLLPVNNLSSSIGVVACIAVFCGEVRLIDNMRIK